MPLLDHFVPPLSVTHPWRGIHSTWAAAIFKQLNDGILPPRFYAIPNIDLGGPAEIDVATLREEAGLTDSDAANGRELWTPPAATMTVPVEYPALDLIEVQIFHDDDGPRLKAAIELVSPSKKDRPASRRAFSVKCASYLNEGASVVVVDTVTSRRGNLHNELVRILELGAGVEWQSSTKLYAAAYRPLAGDEGATLGIWRETLTVGLPLPRMPLWLGVGIAVPLDLQETYDGTCRDLRIRLGANPIARPKKKNGRKKPAAGK
jgi:hypothetical protein